MFEKYNINDLFIAQVDVTYPEPIWESDWQINAGGILLSTEIGYGYLTIVFRKDDMYYELQSNKLLSFSRNPRITSYTIKYLEPLSDYYTQEGKKKNKISRKQAIKEGRKHYSVIHQNILSLSKKTN